MDETTVTSPAQAKAAELLRSEYLDALLMGDPLVSVSTPGLACESMLLGELVLAIADQQAAILARAGAL